MITVISWLIWFGVSESTATWIATSRFLRRAALVMLAAAALASVCWYLIHIGGERKEAEIRRVWAAKFAAMANEGRRLAADRQRANLDVAARVREAVDGLPVITITHVTEPGKCPPPPTLTRDAVRKLNRIK